MPSPEARQLLSAHPMTVAPNFASEVDWRSRGGNYITSIKDQGGCGTCTSFSVCALMEAMASIKGLSLISDGQGLDLSEADSHFCSNHGASCNGWSPDLCLSEAHSRGICQESSFSYESAFPDNDIWAGSPTCHLPENHSSVAVRVLRVMTLSSPTAVKNHLTAVGPVVGMYTVFDDFFYYSSGIYHHVTGDASGGHCVLVIGYSEAERYWICKNSWSDAFGEKGFFRISYDDMLFDGLFYAMYGISGVTLPMTSSIKRNKD